MTLSYCESHLKNMRSLRIAAHRLTSPQFERRPWEVFVVYFDGEDDSMPVENCWTPEEAIAHGAWVPGLLRSRSVAGDDIV